MNQYHPLKGPDPEKWLELDEDERINLVLEYHRRKRVKLPNEQLHAVFHALIETQVAMGDEIPVRRTLERLRGEGLDRHDAIHAIASVMVNHFYHLMKDGGPISDDVNQIYFSELERLTAQGWLKEYES